MAKNGQNGILKYARKANNVEHAENSENAKMSEMAKTSTLPKCLNR